MKKLNINDELGLDDDVKVGKKKLGLGDEKCKSRNWTRIPPFGHANIPRMSARQFTSYQTRESKNIGGMVV